MGISMILLPCAYVVALFVISIHVVLAKHKRRDASSSLPPGPLALPIIGNALYFFRVLRHNPHHALARLNETYGPIASFRVGTSLPYVVVSSPAAAREALIGNDLALTGRSLPDSVRALAHDEGSVFFLPISNPLWKQHRVSISAHFSSRRGIEMSRHIRDRQARRLAEAVRAAAQPVAIGETVFGATVNIISNIVFSRDLADVTSGQQQIHKGLLFTIFEAWTRPNISDAFPFLARLDLFGLRHYLSTYMAPLYKMFDEKVIESRLASDGGGHGDLLDLVLGHHAKSQITRTEIPKLITDLFLAGPHSTSIAVEWTMARLLRHPDKLAKLRAELAASLGSKEFVEESDVVGKLPYLHAVVKETLRLHPPLPVVARDVVAEEGMSLEGFGIPKGTHILVNVWSLGRDPTVWPEPEEFLPERFSGDNDNKKPLNFRGSDFTLLPFGAGRRVCPGMDMAARVVPLLLASLIHKVEWKLPDGMAPEDVDITENCATVLQPATPPRAIPVFTL